MRLIRPTRFALAAAALLAFAPAPSVVLGQDSSPAAAPAGETAPGAPLTAAPQPAATSSGLPSTAAAPRTLRAHWHVYTAFTIAWLLVFGYVISLARRFGRLERELNARGAS